MGGHCAQGRFRLFLISSPAVLNAAYPGLHSSGMLGRSSHSTRFSGVESGASLTWKVQLCTTRLCGSWLTSGFRDLPYCSASWGGFYLRDGSLTGKRHLNTNQSSAADGAHG